MIPYVCRCVPECPICIVPESQDTRIFNIVRKKFLEPGCVRVWASPSFCRISAETMNSNDTGLWCKSEEIIQGFARMKTKGSLNIYILLLG